MKNPRGEKELGVFKKRKRPCGWKTKDESGKWDTMRWKRQERTRPHRGLQAVMKHLDFIPRSVGRC